jgi:hypothetical protein
LWVQPGALPDTLAEQRDRRQELIWTDRTQCLIWTAPPIGWSRLSNASAALWLVWDGNRVIKRDGRAFFDTSESAAKA